MKRLYLKLRFRNTKDLVAVRSEILPAVETNKKRRQSDQVVEAQRELAAASFTVGANSTGSNKRAGHASDSGSVSCRLLSSCLSHPSCIHLQHGLLFSHLGHSRIRRAVSPTSVH